MNTEIARQQMVDQQVRAWDVTDDTVLSLLADLERDEFVPEKYRHLAYAETEIPLGRGQKMMMPVLEGRLLQALEIQPGHSILEIGTGSGFLTACLAKLGARVTSIDLYDEFLQTASDRLKKCEIDNVELSSMDATQQLPAGQFDTIAVTASLPVFDERLVAALNPGGRMFVIVGKAPVMEAQLMEVGKNGDVEVTSLFETHLAPMVHAYTPPPFSF